MTAARYSARNCASFTESLLDFAKGRQTPPLRALDLTAVVAVNAVSLNVPADVTLCLEMGSTPAAILGDFTGITRILHNLVSNAVKAVRNNGRKSRLVTVSAVGCELLVTDNGRGMSDEEVEHFQAGQPVGDGIGLRIVMDQVDKHGAEMFVKSHPRLGTAFRIKFQEA